jgi:hypothetical protein
MIIAIKAKTTIGKAEKIEQKLRKAIMGSRLPLKTDINETEGYIIWQIRASLINCNQISRKAGQIAGRAASVAKNSLFIKATAWNTKESEETVKAAVDDYIDNCMDVSVIEEATANEIVEADKPLWKRLLNRN